jgi:hypothetical protein
MSPFHHIISEAKTWVGPSWEFVALDEIIWRLENGAGGLWYPPWRENTCARITLGWDQPIDGLWHEVFHSVAFRAPLIHRFPNWGEGWCCAFAELQSNKWSPANIFGSCPTTAFERLYSFPATHLLTRACHSRQQLKDIWFAWNRMTAGDFSAYIGYDPDTGQRIQP